MAAATLENLVEHKNGFRLTCDGCHRVVEMNVDELVKKLGDQAELPAIAKRAKCKECGHKGGSVTVVARETLEIKGEYKDTTS